MNQWIFLIILFFVIKFSHKIESFHPKSYFDDISAKGKLNNEFLPIYFVLFFAHTIPNIYLR